jgi:hypothetical protein
VFAEDLKALKVLKDLRVHRVFRKVANENHFALHSTPTAVMY